MNTQSWAITNGEMRELIEKIVMGCNYVKESSDLHDDAKKLAIAIIRDCNIAISKVQQK
jgi:hypothetical protein